MKLKLNKLLLFLEAPFYFYVKWNLQKNLLTPQGRQKLYLRTKSFVPFRRLHVYILDKMYVESLEGRENIYDNYVGFLYDLKHRIQNNFYNQRNIENNYKYALKAVNQVLSSPSSKVKLIIDYGCGAGKLTELIRDEIKNSNVIVCGMDIRPEIMQYNTQLRPDITWLEIAEIANVLKNYSPEQVVLVCNGMVHLLALEELKTLLNYHIKYIFWLYVSFFKDINSLSNNENLVLNDFVTIPEHFNEFNMPRLLKNSGYEFKYQTFAHESDPSAHFVQGISIYSN